MAEWNRRDRDQIRRNYEDVEFTTPPQSDRRHYEEAMANRRGPSARDYRRLTDINQEDYGNDREYERMYDQYTRDYAGYGNGGYTGNGDVYRNRSAADRNRYDRASERDRGRRTDYSAYNPGSGRDFSPDEFDEGRHDYYTAYGPRGAQSRPADYYRNRSELYDGRPEARGWRPDEEASSFASHRGRGPKDYKRSDERIREDINDRLTDDRDLDASNISVTVSNGEVTLNGTVDSKFAKRRAEDIADIVSGVSHVQNNLRVDASRASVSTTATGATNQSAPKTEWGAISPGGSTTAQNKPNNGSTFG